MHRHLMTKEEMDAYATKLKSLGIQGCGRISFSTLTRGPNDRYWNPNGAIFNPNKTEQVDLSFSLPAFEVWVQELPLGWKIDLDTTVDHKLIATKPKKTAKYIGVRVAADLNKIIENVNFSFLGALNLQNGYELRRVSFWWVNEHEKQEATPGIR